MREVAKGIAYSYATVHAAMRGPKVPRWPVLELIVEKLDGNVDQFKQLWVSALDFHESNELTPLDGGATAVNTGIPKAHAASSTSLPGGELPAISAERIHAALDELDILHAEEDEDTALAFWSRCSITFATEGPDKEILVIRTRSLETLPIRDLERARSAVNEWNHTRRFMKAYVGDPTKESRLPIYGEMQVPLGQGATDQQLLELVDCGAAVGTALVDWLHDEMQLIGQEATSDVPRSRRRS
ncbi:YbjN domain-containing protein [Micromonospora sp. NPDC002296]|uniref:YbjN domain-containing protein n=1 Tax=Micromonospora sp. NPDC002296 TaxID=3154271 RepID=UPI003326841B